MATRISSEHPRQKLLFYVVDGVDNIARDSVRAVIEELTHSRPWVIGPPQFVETRDPESPGSTVAPIETIGGELEIYSALAPAVLPKEVDSNHFNEVEAIVEALRALSDRQGLAFDFELGDTYVGGIANGQANQTLRVGFLGEWRKQLFS
jgi:hypothetical protein